MLGNPWRGKYFTSESEIVEIFNENSFVRWRDPSISFSALCEKRDHVIYSSQIFLTLLSIGNSDITGSGNKQQGISIGRKTVNSSHPENDKFLKGFFWEGFLLKKLPGWKIWFLFITHNKHMWNNHLILRLLDMRNSIVAWNEFHSRFLLPYKILTEEILFWKSFEAISKICFCCLFFEHFMIFPGALLNGEIIQFQSIVNAYFIVCRCYRNWRAEGGWMENVIFRIFSL